MNESIDLAKKFLDIHASMTSPEFSSTARYESNRIQVNWLAAAFDAAINQAREADSQKLDDYRAIISDLEDTTCDLRSEKAELESKVLELTEAIESDAAKEAYEAGFGASEWEAFLGPKCCVALADTTPATDIRERIREQVINECIKKLEIVPCSSAAEEGAVWAMELLQSIKKEAN